MKKMLFGIALCSTMLVSCQNDTVDSFTLDSTGFSGSFDLTESRVYLHEDDFYRWETGDEVSVFTADSRNRKYKAVTGDVIQTDLEFVSKPENSNGISMPLKSNYAIFPYNESNCLSLITGPYYTLSTILPSEQVYDKNKKSLDYAIMVSKIPANETLFTFKNSNALIKLNINAKQDYADEATIQTIKVESKAHKLAGTVKMEVEQNDYTATIWEEVAHGASTPSNTITLTNCSDAGTIGTVAKTFLLVIPAGVYEAGDLTFTIDTDKDTYDLTISTKNSYDVKRSQYIELNATLGSDFEGTFDKEILTEIPASIDLNNETVKIVTNLDATQTLTVNGTGTLLLNSHEITTTNGPAIKIGNGANVTFEVKGDVSLKGSTHGIEIPNDATLKITGKGNLTVIGNNGEDNADDTDGSGISGSVEIDGLSSLTAKGYGKNGYGIGSANATVTIKNTKNIVAQGGYVQPNFISDTSYGKKEPEGAPAIGGAKIVLDNVEVTKIDGGSKAAGIGARYHESTDITIKNSIINEVNGGNASAGIGGSRVQDIYAPDPQTIKITISQSTITANGGEFGAGIGTGYCTYTSNGNIKENNIVITASNITAQGGRGASGIGTGYHVAMLTGSIDASSTISATAGALVDEDLKWGCRITYPQNIGYGGVDPNREYKDVTPTFTVKGIVIDEPTEYTKSE